MSSLTLRLPVLLLVPVAALVGFGLRGFAAPAAVSAGPVVVVDLFRVVDEAKPFVQEREGIRRWIDEQKRSNLSVKKDAIAAKEAELELFEVDSEPHRKLRFELDFEKLAFQHEFERLEAIRVERIVRAQKAAYEKARVVIGRVARQSGARAALQLRPHELLGRDEKALSSEMFLRDVLWNDASLDITPEVIRILGETP